MDQSLLERVNPVFNTAKMCLFQLAAMGDKDAAEISQKLNLTFHQTQDSSTTKASPEQVSIGIAMLQIRYNATYRMALSAGCKTLVDLPCGYTPRALQCAREGLNYLGLDLPATIAEINPVIGSMLTPEQRTHVKMKGVDATNYASLEAALEGVKGPICVTTEGLLMYFTDSEVSALCENICRLLKKYGGCWITADPESGLQYVLMAQALFGNDFMRVMNNAKQGVKDKSDVEVGQSTIIVRPGPNVAESIGGAMKYFAQRSLTAERLPVADFMPEMTTVDAAQRPIIREAMKKCAYWKLTTGRQAVVPTADKTTQSFVMETQLEGDRLFLTLTGRVDTLTAPTMLKAFEDISSPIRSVNVDCSALDYISSAGLRVLLIMRKKCPEGVTLTGVNDAVMEILTQTGFDGILTIE